MKIVKELLDLAAKEDSSLELNKNLQHYLDSYCKKELPFVLNEDSMMELHAHTIQMIHFMKEGVKLTTQPFFLFLCFLFVFRLSICVSVYFAMCVCVCFLRWYAL